MELSKLQENVSKLPKEIQLIILSYTYSPQPKYLINDIKHFLLSRELIQRMYYHYWEIYFEYEPEADQNWLDNDLVGYMNDNQATMRGYTKKMYTILQRSFYIQHNLRKMCIDKITPSNEKMVKSLVKCMIYPKKSIRSSNNILWGLLTTEERDEFIRISPVINREA